MYDQPIISFMTIDPASDARVYHVCIDHLAIGSVMNPSYNQVLPAQLLERLRMHGRCRGCSRPLDPTLQPCSCAHKPPFGAYLEVAIADTAALPTFDLLVAKLLDRHKSKVRRQRLGAVKSTLTDAEVVLLLDWQKQMCFYCGVPFAEVDGRLQYRRDHWLAVAAGGETTIENTVLACVRCNCSKGERNADTVLRQCARARDPAVKVAYAAMRRRFRQRLAHYLAQQDGGQPSRTSGGGTGATA